MFNLKFCSRCICHCWYYYFFENGFKFLSKIVQNSVKFHTYFSISSIPIVTLFKVKTAKNEEKRNEFHLQARSRLPTLFLESKFYINHHFNLEERFLASLADSFGLFYTNTPSINLRIGLMPLTLRMFKPLSNYIRVPMVGFTFNRILINFICT